MIVILNLTLLLTALSFQFTRAQIATDQHDCSLGNAPAYPVILYSFDETSGKFQSDFSSPSYDLTRVGTIGNGEGAAPCTRNVDFQDKGSVFFGGLNNEYLLMEGGVTFPSASFTIAFWMRITENRVCGIMAHMAPEGDIQYFLAADTTIKMTKNGIVMDSSISTSTIVNSWTHIVLVYDSVLFSFSAYKNGMHHHTRSIGPVLQMPDGPGVLMFGNWPTSYFPPYDILPGKAFMGYLDHFMVFDYEHSNPMSLYDTAEVTTFTPTMGFGTSTVATSTANGAMSPSSTSSTAATTLSNGTPLDSTTTTLSTTRRDGTSTHADPTTTDNAAQKDGDIPTLAFAVGVVALLLVAMFISVVCVFRRSLRRRRLRRDLAHFTSHEADVHAAVSAPRPQFIRMRGASGGGSSRSVHAHQSRRASTGPTRAFRANQATAARSHRSRHQSQFVGHAAPRVTATPTLPARENRQSIESSVLSRYQHIPPALANSSRGASSTSSYANAPISMRDGTDQYIDAPPPAYGNVPAYADVPVANENDYRQAPPPPGNWYSLAPKGERAGINAAGYESSTNLKEKVRNSGEEYVELEKLHRVDTDVVEGYY